MDKHSAESSAESHKAWKKERNCGMRNNIEVSGGRNAKWNKAVEEGLNALCICFHEVEKLKSQKGTATVVTVGADAMGEIRWLCGDREQVGMGLVYWT